VTVFVVDDDMHADRLGEFATIADAWAELRRVASLPFDQEPNQPPCGNWQNCRRSWYIIEYDNTQKPWRQLRTISALEFSAEGPKWQTEPGSA